MKKILILFILANMFLVTLLGSLVFLAETHPLRPGNPLYAAQQQAEQWRLRLIANPTRQAEIAFGMAERRLADLAETNEPCCIDVAIAAFDQALNEAIVRIEPAPDSARDGLYENLKRLLVQSEVVLASLHLPDQDGQTAALVAALAHKIASLQQAETHEQLVAMVPANVSFVQAVAIPFLGQEMDHTIYPLTGAHANVECDACHPTGQYADVPNQCRGCHAASLDNLYALALYPNHFPGECSDCHVVDNWTPYQFDHAGVFECQSCHLKHNPAGHYAGTCLLCHTNVVDWKVTTYAHLDVTECRSCHLKDSPPNHYVRLEVLSANVGLQGSALPYPAPATCLNCHRSTSSWHVVAFDHSGFDDCAACHSADQPGTHFQGQCSKCHTVESWRQAWFSHDGMAICQKCHTPKEQDHYLDECSTCHTPGDTWKRVAVDHAAFDGCLSCHADDSPTEHYSGQCDSCHYSDSWEDVLFNHEGFTDCEECHSREHHYPGQCSTCHGTDSWLEYDIDHTGFTDCRSCHNDLDHGLGQCSKCHNTHDWNDVDFDHDGLPDCAACHDEEVPSGHYDEQCSDCHNTYSWDDPDFNHGDGADCESCHDSPDGHWPGQCSTCHNSSYWYDIDVDHGDLDDCQSCHNPPDGHWSDQCSDCHNTERWRDVYYDHTGLEDCQSCHTPPTGHWPGTCSNCHCTCDWSNIEFDHTGYTSCNSCHSDDRPSSPHPQRYVCSRCHTTDSWAGATP